MELLDPWDFAICFIYFWKTVRKTIWHYDLYLICVGNYTEFLMASCKVKRAFKCNVCSISIHYPHTRIIFKKIGDAKMLNP